ncbi:uncharacterized protein C15orf65 homolog [Sceloporus undulatus]|uniref:uncharacterized protein C15orf65 homolog n=1 Tax=Sceloporus undulatus TaxID=8520 RepID=UPI001C4B20A6|nr:uncharacterized protein C15orf65 homolog [Sceloporus undulatus]
MAAEPPCAMKDPSAQRCPCANPGNPVFSCMLDPKALPSALPGKRGRPLAQAQLLIYRTTSSDYGQLPPEPQAAPCRFCPRENTFTNHLLACGRTPSGGINTGIDRGRVIDHKDLVNTL